jgi:glutamate-ammonia-ligase adenylyltransferase
VKLREGGLIELEFLVQALMLRAAGPALPTQVTREAITRLTRNGDLSAEEGALLGEADLIWRSVQGLLRIALGRTIPKSLSGTLLEKIAALCGTAAEEPAVLARLDSLASDVRAAFVRHLGEIGQV